MTYNPNFDFGAIYIYRLARGITAAIWTCAGPQRLAPWPVLAAALGPLACPSRSARPRNCLNLANSQIILK